jgi:hypothetical protein
MNIPVGTLVTFASDGKIVRGRVLGQLDKRSYYVVEVHPDDRHLTHTHGGLGLFTCPNNFCRFVTPAIIRVSKAEVLKQFIAAL